MADDGLEKRRKALEESFFAQKNAELLAQLKADVQAKEAQESIASQLGVDAALAKALFDLDIHADTVAALSLVPLVAVAWADGTIEPAEREAILKAADGRGIAAGSAPRELLSQWLEEKPSPELIGAWSDYIKGLQSALSPAEHRKLGEELIGLAREVANAAGGFLGIGKISDAEEAMLNQLKQPFA